MAVAERAPILWVSAGLNWAGKSSIVGEMIRQSGADYFNPDEVARRLRELQPGLLPGRAKELAWKQGKRLLEESIAARHNFAFETTPGGRTIPRFLHAAMDVGFEVRRWFLALESADRHVERVRARVVGEGTGMQNPDGRFSRTRYPNRKAEGAGPGNAPAETTTLSACRREPRESGTHRDLETKRSSSDTANSYRGRPRLSQPGH